MWHIKYHFIYICTYIYESVKNIFILHSPYVLYLTERTFSPFTDLQCKFLYWNLLRCLNEKIMKIVWICVYAYVCEFVGKRINPLILKRHISRISGFCELTFLMPDKSSKAEFQTKNNNFDLSDNAIRRSIHFCTFFLLIFVEINLACTRFSRIYFSFRSRVRVTAGSVERNSICIYTRVRFLPHYRYNLNT